MVYCKPFFNCYQRIVKAVVTVTPTVSVNDGDMANLSCEAKGYPMPSITWKKKGMPVSNGVSNQHLEMINHYGKELKVGPVSLSDNGTVYTCEVIQGSFVTVKSSMLIVKGIVDLSV